MAMQHTAPGLLLTTDMVNLFNQASLALKVAINAKSQTQTFLSFCLSFNANDYIRMPITYSPKI